MPNGTNVDNFWLMRLLREEYEVVCSEHPNYLIVSCFGKEHLNYNHCIKIFWTGESVVPDFNLFDYAIGFDDICFGDRYFRMPLYYFYPGVMKKVMEKPIYSLEEMRREKIEFANFVYSNAGADPFRERLFEEMNQYKPVISGGRYRNNIGAPVKNKMELLQKCKFTIACENSEYPGYTTEKLLEAFAANTIPIYWGNPLVEKEFNRKSFINCYRYNSIEEVVGEMIRMDQNDDYYLKILNEPAFLEKAWIEKQVEDFKRFLYHIFDQDIEKAKRKNRSYWGIGYENNQLEIKSIMELWNNRYHPSVMMKFLGRKISNKIKRNYIIRKNKE